MGEDAHDYLSEDKLKETAKKYSQFIQFPIYVKVKKEVDADTEEDDDDDKDDEEEEKKDDVETKDDDEILQGVQQEFEDGLLRRRFQQVEDLEAIAVYIYKVGG